jgi:hypothetical protein
LKYDGKITGEFLMVILMGKISWTYGNIWENGGWMECIGDFNGD